MFFSKSKGPEITDVVYLGESGCSKGISLWLDRNPTGIVAVWFQQDLENLRRSLAGKPGERFVLADRLAFSASSGRPVLFAGHYPLHAAELDLCDSLGIKEMLVYSHFDMPLLKLFGAEGIKNLMLKMGMAEDEPLTHAMISKSIGNAQERIAKQNITDMHARSEEDWMSINAIGQR